MMGGIWHALRTQDSRSLADLIRNGEDVNAEGAVRVI